MKKEKLKEIFIIGVISGFTAAITLVMLFFAYVKIRELYDEYKSNTVVEKTTGLKGTVCRFRTVEMDSIYSKDSIY